ncbi:hypothetical protein [Sporosarcina sp. JAI121]|uniref:hypothetical protein n=1 Tax=Sporosarcina sp. JAI121 TaxID=2723064 RepID=UPI0015C9C389|nr:hypothetical protein [Sporosarcina sp. JAI121]NYF26469.1 hypothetical protein [Sporosarcina sp. JAI121]
MKNAKYYSLLIIVTIFFVMSGCTNEPLNELSKEYEEAQTSSKTNKAESDGKDHNVEREMTKEEVRQIQSIFMNDSVKLLNAQLSYEPHFQEPLKSMTESTDSVGEVKKIRDNKLPIIHLTIQKENTEYYLQIFEDEIKNLKRNHKEIDKMGSWNLIVNNEATSGEKTYNIAVSTINLKDRVFTVLIQNYDVNTDTSVMSYKRSEIESFINTLQIENSINVLLTE